jgi:hypothetical protein
MERRQHPPAQQNPMAAFISTLLGGIFTALELLLILGGAGVVLVISMAVFGDPVTAFMITGAVAVALPAVLLLSKRVLKTQ